MRLELGRWELTGLHLALAVLVLSLVAVLIVVAVMLPGRSADTVDVPAPALRYEWATVDRLVLPDDFESLGELEWVPYRPRREVWTDEQIAEHWLDPAAIGLDVLDEQVEAHVRNLLEEVP
ncbi:MAG: hypothetical protein ACOC7V_16775 [Spirochaetota bacterium]